MTVKTVLVPIDFSDHSKRALEWAKALAEKFDASLHLLTVIPDPFALPNPGPLYVPPQAGYVEGLRSDAEAQLRDLLASSERMRFGGQFTVAFGDAAAEIVDLAKRTSTDLVVMGTHGRAGVTRAVLGSVADKVIRTVSCPVVVVR